MVFIESIDSLYSEDLKLVQAQKGYRFGIDPVLLADFVSLSGRNRGLDLGCGCGILPLLLVRRQPNLEVVGWERQAAMVERAERSVALSGFSPRVSIVEADLRDHRNLTRSGGFDLVVSNPPYRPLGQGRIAPDDERAAARHELAGGLEDFLRAASWALGHKGRFGIVYLAERMPELLTGMSACDIAPKRIRMVHPRRGEAARMVLVEGCKGGAPGVRIEAPLYIYRGNGSKREYTAEVLRIYGG